MGVPQTGGATGRLTIDVSQLQAARAGVATFSSSALTALNNVSAASNVLSDRFHRVVGEAVAMSNARAGVQSFSTGAVASLNNVTVASERTQRSLRATAMAALRSNQAKFAGTALATGLGSLGGPMGAMAGAMAGANPAVAVGMVAAGVIKGGQAAVMAASDLTEAINKTSVAFGESGTKILEWSKTSATALAMSRHQALEAASTFGLLFTTMGVASTESAAMSMALVQLAADMASINNISPEEALVKLRAGLVGEVEPLRTVGVLLNAAAVEAKAMQMGLAESTQAITEQDKVLARYQLILEQTKLTQGDLARTSGDLANQTRIAQANWQNLLAAFGTMIEPAVTDVITHLNAILVDTIALLKAYQQLKEKPWIDIGSQLPGWMTADPVGDFLKNNRFTGDITGGANSPYPFFEPIRQGVAENRTRDIGRHPSRTRGGAGTVADVNPQVGEAKLDWARGVNDINAKLHADIISAESSYGESRANTIRTYQKGVAREERDFQRSRLRANIDFLDSVAAVGKDAARREAKANEDLARSIGQMQSDAAERSAGAERDHQKKVGQLRSDAAEALADMEEEFAKNRERAAAQHRDSLLDAAGRLDAHAVYEEQRNYARQRKDAEEAHQDARDDLQKNLDKQIDQANEAHAERIADEKEALDKSIRQAQEAHARQQEENRIADAERIADMKADFVQRKAREDEDRGIRLADQAQDHADSLAAAAAAHGERMEQIRANAAKEREQFQIDHEAKMVDLGIADEAMKARVLAREKVLIDSYDRYWDHVEKRMEQLANRLSPGLTPQRVGDPSGIPAYAAGGPVASTGLALLHAGEFVLPASSASMRGGNTSHSRNITVQPGAITINESLRPGDTAREVESALIRILEREAA